MNSNTNKIKKKSVFFEKQKNFLRIFQFFTCLGKISPTSCLQRSTEKKIERKGRNHATKKSSPQQTLFPKRSPVFNREQDPSDRGSERCGYPSCSPSRDK